MEQWDWSTEGDEWSAWWGGTRAMWFGAILPRIHAFVPARAILEIGPGYGRWTQYLKNLTERLVAVDLSQNCVDHCRSRFADATHIEYFVNDGLSLAMIEPRSIDFAFSFDSLVHAEPEIVEGYLSQLAETLTANGVALLHHSNLGEYPRAVSVAKRLPKRYLRRIINGGLAIDLLAWRAETMTAERFAGQCDAVGLSCIGQEKINWEHGHWCTDTLSLVTLKGSIHDRENVVIRNRAFQHDAHRLAALYARR